MATIVLSAAGMALGASVGGTALGLSAATIGRAIGASVGRVIDQRLLGAGSETIETGQVDRFRLTGASEGTAIPRLYGRVRVGGQVIWATEFLETKTKHGGSGKGGPPKPTTVEYSYSVSVAIALCEGEITRVGRVWADGREVSPDDLNMRVYAGSEDQMPDPKMEAVEGAGNVPAYRGTAYVVLEDLDLGQFGNRVPQFTFEVSRPAQPDLEDETADMTRMVKAVALMPGTGEYALATTPVHITREFGEQAVTNVNSASGKSDLQTSLDHLDEELPDCGSVSMIVSWFGDDLRADQCTLRPKVEQTTADGNEMPWRVSGLTRAGAQNVPVVDDRVIYGGTPADQSVVEALIDIADRGKKAVFYPFILMDQLDGNGLINPWTGQAGQPHLPWRGRITLSAAPGQVGTPDRTAAAAAEVAAFFGTAAPADFTQAGNTVTYSGPNEWSYRRFILHYAHLCAMAGGVDAFCIGSEMRSLTQIRGAGDSFPAVDAMIQLAADVRGILGPSTKIGYAADWSEYHGYQPGGANKYFHLDPLWADDNIDFIGIDNYMPLSDWRDGLDHADVDARSIYNLDYLRANVAGGEGYDWYYHSPESRAAQIRTPITDSEGEEWIWRYKDIQNWWGQYHHNRIDGVRDTLPTIWEPGSKPIWFTELGCAAIDKGTNEPNKFLDPKSSESSVPHYSNGIRDDFIQMQYLRAVHQHYADVGNNPISLTYGGPMVDMSRAHVWAWDARPHPFFPVSQDIWSDGENYARGHWITGRSAARPLASVVAEICEKAGVADYDTSRLFGLVKGYLHERVGTARSALQPLMLAHGFDVVDRDGALHFITRTGMPDATLEFDDLAVPDDVEGDIEFTRSAEAEMAGRVRLNYVAGDGDYEVATSEASLADDTAYNVSQSELPIVMSRGEGQGVVERWLAEARVARDGVRFALPPSMSHLGAGDVVRIQTDQGGGIFRMDRVEQAKQMEIEAVGVEPEVYRAHNTAEVYAPLQTQAQAVPVEGVFLDLPLMTGDEVPHAPHVGFTSKPWPGSVALYSSTQDANYAVNTIADQSAIIGITETELVRAAPGLWDRGPALRVKLVRGALLGVTPEQILSGANLAAIGDGTPENWELFQFTNADLVAPDTYELTLRLRGQAGSDGLMPDQWPVGSLFVLMDDAMSQIGLNTAARGVLQHYRYGPSQRALGDATYRYRAEAFRGAGLRPYAVAHLRAKPNGADTDLTWIRRTRLDGDSWDGFDVPLGEAVERYQVKVFQSGTLVRDDVITTPNWTYSAAQKASDGISGPYHIQVAQLSESFGPGPFKGLDLDG